MQKNDGQPEDLNEINKQLIKNIHIQGEGTKYRGLITRKFALESTHYD